MEMVAGYSVRFAQLLPTIPRTPTRSRRATTRMQGRKLRVSVIRAGMYSRGPEVTADEGSRIQVVKALDIAEGIDVDMTRAVARESIGTFADRNGAEAKLVAAALICRGAARTSTLVHLCLPTDAVVVFRHGISVHESRCRHCPTG